MILDELDLLKYFFHRIGVYWSSFHPPGFGILTQQVAAHRVFSDFSCDYGVIARELPTHHVFRAKYLVHPDFPLQELVSLYFDIQHSTHRTKSCAVQYLIPRSVSLPSIMLYTRAILLTMLLALAGAGSGVNAAPAHVCRDLVPRGADSQGAQSQSPAPESSSKSTALRADGQEAPIQSSATSRYSGLRSPAPDGDCRKHICNHHFLQFIPE
ncbi:hypothetical protein FB446DRAFT_78538 [Lentinula raphanica]|nr:hypothetical protein FB446DRAFT_78538 [Lentinula raphanica]